MSVKKTVKSAVGIRFDYEIDGVNDRLYIPVNSYFYEKSSAQVWYKDLYSKYYSIWGNSDETYSRAESRAVKQTEVDFGLISSKGKSFTVADTNVSSTSKILAQVAYDAPTNKSLDELEMDEIIVRAGSSANGSFKVFVTEARNCSLYGKFKINYTIS